LKLKILIVTNLFPPQVLGGYERSIADFAHLLHERGHQVLVLTSNTPFFSDSRMEPPTELEVRRCLLLGGEWHLGRAAEWFSIEEVEKIDAQNLQMLADCLGSFEPNVCLAGNMDLMPVCILEYILANQTPIAHYVMNAMPGYLPNLAPRSPLYRYIACSHWVQQSLFDKGFPAETIATVYPGAAVEAFFQPQLPPRDQLRIAYSSLLMKYKGADVLIEALCMLRSAGIRFTASLAGGTLDPVFLGGLKELVVANGLTDCVSFLGILTRDEIVQMYKRHNVLVFPSRFDEPFGISQIEAMAAGLTLVTSGTGGAREIVEHGQNGIVFESGNASDLANMLALLIEHPLEWEQITRQGQQNAMQRFSQTRAVESLENLLFKVACLKT